MMVAVVDNGTGTNAQIPGVEVAGKTGTAQSGSTRPPYAWFVSFAPADDPAGRGRRARRRSRHRARRDRRRRPGGPIAKAVMEAVISK